MIFEDKYTENIAQHLKNKGFYSGNKLSETFRL
jgi:hypothetical protein